MYITSGKRRCKLVMEAEFLIFSEANPLNVKEQPGAGCHQSGAFLEKAKTFKLMVWKLPRRASDRSLCPSVALAVYTPGWVKLLK